MDAKIRRKNAIHISRCCRDSPYLLFCSLRARPYKNRRSNWMPDVIGTDEERRTPIASVEQIVSKEFCWSRPCVTQNADTYIFYAIVNICSYKRVYYSFFVFSAFSSIYCCFIYALDTEENRCRKRRRRRERQRKKIDVIDSHAAHFSFRNEYTLCAVRVTLLLFIEMFLVVDLVALRVSFVVLCAQQC